MSKSKKQIKHLHRIIILVILICVVATSVSLTPDSQDRMIEHHTGEVLHVIDGWLNEFESADKDDRTFKINTFLALSDYQAQLSNHVIQSEVIDSEFIVVLNQIVDWFFDNYLDMVDEIAEAAAGNTDEIQQYLTDISEEIDKLIEAFDSDDFDPDEERSYRAELFVELSNILEMFMDDDFIALRIDENEVQLHELTEVIVLIEEESIIDNERITVIYGMISSLFDEYIDTDQTATIKAHNVLGRIEAELALQRIWFEDYYVWLIDEIVDMEVEDEYDDETVKSQIEGLEQIRQFIEDDGVVSLDFLQLKSEQIERLIEYYESDLEIITERIKEREAEAARAAAANRSNTGTTSNNRTGTSSSNTSNNSNRTTSSTTNSNTSGSSSGSAAVTGNNRYPSISSNCREMLARLVKLEAPNEGADGKQAVAEVVLNRMVSSRWSHANTVAEVINDDKWGVQFTVKDLIWTDRGNPTTSDFAAVDRALSGSNILSREYVFFNTKPVTQNDVIWIGTHAFSK